MDEGFLDGLVRILQLDILTDKDNLNLVLRVLNPVEESLPPAQFRRSEIVNLEFADGELVQMLLVHVERNLINAPGIDALDDMAGADVAEQGDLALKFRRQGMLGTADDDVRFDSTLLKHLDRVLRGFGLEFLRCAQVGD